MSDDLTGPLFAELSTIDPGTTGVIIGLRESCTAQQAETILALLRERFPGVSFAVIDQVSAIATFTFYEPEAV